MIIKQAYLSRSAHILISQKNGIVIVMSYRRYLLFIFSLLSICIFTTGCDNVSLGDAPEVYYHSILLYNDTNYDVIIEYDTYSLSWIDIFGELVGLYSLATESIDLNARDKIVLTVASYSSTWGKYIVVYRDIRNSFEFADEFKTMHIHPMDLEE
jgi:hypothetical protein